MLLRVVCYVNVMLIIMKWEILFYMFFYSLYVWNLEASELILEAHDN